MPQENFEWPEGWDVRFVPEDSVSKMVRFEPVSPVLNRTPTGSYAELIAASLVLYAEHDALFALWLTYHLPDVEGARYPEETMTRRMDAAELIAAPDIQTAWQRADWLFARINSLDIPGTDRAAALLRTWKEIKNPPGTQPMMLGFMLIALPRERKASDRNSMTIILRDDLAKERSLNAIHAMSHAILGVLCKTFDMADGTFQKLEPEISEWLFGEQNLSIFQATEEHLSAMAAELERLDIPFAAVREEDGMAALAMDPTVDRRTGELHWRLRYIPD